MPDRELLIHHLRYVMFIVKLHPVNPGLGAPLLTQPSLHPCHSLGRALHVPLHRVVPRVETPAHQAEVARRALGVLPEEDSLHAAKHLELDTDQRRHVGPPRAGGEVRNGGLWFRGSYRGRQTIWRL